MRRSIVALDFVAAFFASTVAFLAAFDDELSSLVEILSDEGRRALSRPPSAFPGKAAAIVHEARRLTEATAFAGIDPDDIELGVTRAAALDPIEALRRE